MFQTPPEWDVRHKERTLGRISPSPDLAAGVCLLLVGRVWEVTEVLPEQKQVLVVPAQEARNVMFSGSGVPEMHHRIAEGVLKILLRDDMPRYLSSNGQAVLAQARRLSQELQLGQTAIYQTEKEWIIFPWTGTRAARALQVALRRVELGVSFPSMLFPWVMAIKRDDDRASLLAKLKRLLEVDLSAEALVADVPVELLRTHKFDEFLPESLLRARAADEWLDWGEGQRVLERITSAG